MLLYQHLSSQFFDTFSDLFQTDRLASEDQQYSINACDAVSGQKITSI